MKGIIIIISVVIFSIFTGAMSNAEEPVRLSMRSTYEEPGPGVNVGFELRFAAEHPYWRESNNIGGLWLPAGADFDVVYQNELLPPQPSIIHAHGLTPPQGLDGVPYVSALPLPAGQSIRVNYGVQDMAPGTYWLHSHYGFQRSSGLAAPLILLGNEGYVYEDELDEAQDEAILLQDFCGQPSDAANSSACFPANYIFAQLEEEYNNSTHDTPTCPGIEPATDADVSWRFITINRKAISDPVVIDIGTSRYLRLRFINAASTTIMLVQLPFPATLVAVDGQFVYPVELDGDDDDHDHDHDGYQGYNNHIDDDDDDDNDLPPYSFWIAIAQRVDVLIDLDQTPGKGTFPIYAYSQGVEDSIVGAILLRFPNSSTSGYEPPIPGFAPGLMGFGMEEQLHAWWPISKTIPPPVVNQSFTLYLTGDNGFNSINGYGWQLPPHAPVYTPNPHPLNVHYGDRVLITFANRNNDPHPFHLHRHSFQVVALDGSPVKGAVRDTLLIPGGCHNATVLLIADNPGTSLIHCHNEFHLVAGMATTLDYIV